MKHLAGAANINAGHGHLSATWLSVGAMIRLSATLVALAGVWLLVTWAVALP